jgi:hypothetical protein
MSISSGTQYMTLQKYFSHPSLVICFYPTPTHKTKTGTAKRRETTNKEGTHLDQSNYLANQQQVLGLAVPSPALANSAKVF